MIEKIIKQRDGNKCYICKSIDNIIVHQINDNIKTSIGATQYLKWFVSLCDKCYEKVNKDVNHKFNKFNYLKNPV